MSSLNVRAFGVALGIATNDPALDDAVRALLPPGHVPGGAGESPARLSLDREGATFRVVHDGEPVVAGADLPDALNALDSRIRLIVASGAPELVFVHAGVVAAGDRAIVIPGSTTAGKTELVAALLREGATYYSDEFAVLDRDGLVHPYAKPLTLRRGAREKERLRSEELGSTDGTARAPVAVIAMTAYEPGAAWAPRTCSAAEGAMFLLAHAGQTRDDAERVMASITLAAEHALVLEGPRGEAAPAARALLTAAGEAHRDAI